MEISPGLVTEISEKIMPEVTAWQNRPLEPVYPFVFVNVIHYKVGEDRRYVTKAAHVVLGVTMDGRKDILGVWIGEHENSKFWLNVLNDLKSRGRFGCISVLHGRPVWDDAGYVVTLEEAEKNLQIFAVTWRKQYHSCVKSWEKNWEVLSTFFEYPVEIRKIIYTTSIIEGMNRQFRQITKNKPSFTNDDSLRQMPELGSGAQPAGDHVR